MRYGSVACLRALAAALGVIGASLLVLAGAAGAATFPAGNTAQLEEAVSKANATSGANTIVLSAGAYLPITTLTLTNTSGLQTIEGTTTAPPAKIEGSAVEPFPSELFEIDPSVSVEFKNLEIAHGGGPGVTAIGDFGSLDVESSTIAGNTGVGVLVEPGASATVRNSTLSDGLDFGLVDDGTASFFNSTVAFNKNGGIEKQGTLNLTNTIVAENTGSGDCAGAATTSDHSLDSDGSCNVGTLSKTNPLLVTALVNNGGPTPTHALKTGSPAIKAGDKATCTTTDQRGFPRPGFPGAACSIGAVEAYAPAHFFVNGVGNGSRAPEGEAIPVISWGTLTLVNTKGGTGSKLTCHDVAGGFVENPGEGATGAAGIGETQTFNPYACESKACTAAATGGGAATYLSVVAEPTPFSSPTSPGGSATNLGWKSQLVSEGALIRRETEGVKLNLHCNVETGTTGSGEPIFGTVKSEQYLGTIKPSSGPARLTAANPPFVEFDSVGAGSGELHGPSGEEGRLAKFEGELKVLGYNGQELVNTKLA
jgi:hypothetical protein